LGWVGVCCAVRLDWLRVVGFCVVRWCGGALVVGRGWRVLLLHRLPVRDRLPVRHRRLLVVPGRDGLVLCRLHGYDARMLLLLMWVGKDHVAQKAAAANAACQAHEADDVPPDQKRLALLVGPARALDAAIILALRC